VCNSPHSKEKYLQKAQVVRVTATGLVTVEFSDGVHRSKPQNLIPVEKGVLINETPSESDWDSLTDDSGEPMSPMTKAFLKSMDELGLK
jgi:hypothetical protein